MDKKGNQSNYFVSEVLYRLNVNSEIDKDLLRKALGSILSDENMKARDVQLSALLTGIMVKGPEKEEIVTLLESIFELDGFSPYNKHRITLPNGEKLVGAIGSGKKGFKTMNISTPSLLVASAAGVYTTKPVSKATSSLSGSADLMQELGVNLNLSIEETEKIITKCRFGVFSIENLIPKFNKIYSGKFYVPHALSFGLAALVSPVEYDHILYGLAHPNIDLSLNILREFGIKNAMVVSTTHDGIHYLDEMGVYGKTRLKGMRNGNIGREIYFRPTEELNLPRYTPYDIMQGKTLEENIKYTTDVLRGQGEQAREDIVCINAGTVLYLANKAGDLKEGFAISKQIIKKGLPLEKLIEVIDTSNGDKKKLNRYLDKK